MTGPQYKTIPYVLDDRLKTLQDAAEVALNHLLSGEVEEATELLRSVVPTHCNEQHPGQPAVRCMLSPNHHGDHWCTGLGWPRQEKP